MGGERGSLFGEGEKGKDDIFLKKTRRKVQKSLTKRSSNRTEREQELEMPVFF